MGGERERETATPRGRALCDLPLAELIQSTVELRCDLRASLLITALDYTLPLAVTSLAAKWSQVIKLAKYKAMTCCW